MTGRTEFAVAARSAVDYTVTRQRSDGAWPYGEAPGLSWIDGFHTGYVLDCLHSARMLVDAALCFTSTIGDSAVTVTCSVTLVIAPPSLRAVPPRA